jgi:hypothetical protein
MISKSRIKSSLCMLVVLTVLGGCCYKATEPLPDTDIVFQAATDDDRPYRLGFIQADGSDLQYVEVRPYSYFGGMPICPVQTSDGTLLIFYGSHGASDPVSAITSDGYLIEYDDHYGGSGCGIAPVPDSHQAVVSEAYTGGSSKDIKRRIQLLDLDEKTAVQTYVTTTGAFIDVGTNALHETSLVYRRSREENGVSMVELVLLNIETKRETVLLTEERLSQPAISPDGRSVAYTAEDGIYIVDVEKGESRHVMETCVWWTPEADRFRQRDNWPPTASWSPDGRWLVYHRCTQPCSQRCENVEDYSIFKINLETGEEELLVEGGLNPYWRLDVAR